MNKSQKNSTTTLKPSNTINKTATAQRSFFLESMKKKWATFPTIEETTHSGQRPSTAWAIHGDSTGTINWKWQEATRSRRQKENWKTEPSKVQASTSTKSTPSPSCDFYWSSYLINHCTLLFQVLSINIGCYKQQLTTKNTNCDINNSLNLFPKCSQNTCFPILKAFTLFVSERSSILKLLLTKRSISTFWFKAAHTSSSFPSFQNFIKSINTKSQPPQESSKNPEFTSSPNPCPKSTNAKSSKPSAVKSNKSSKIHSETAKPHNNSSIWTEKSTLKSEKNWKKRELTRKFLQYNIK